MSYHIVSIDSPQCSLSCRDGHLTCKDGEKEKKLPLEDVASTDVISLLVSLHLGRSHLVTRFQRFCSPFDFIQRVALGFRIKPHSGKEILVSKPFERPTEKVAPKLFRPSGTNTERFPRPVFEIKAKRLLTRAARR
jgi:hypothetical protein